jgi:DNA ligase (NAD+)
MKKTDILALNKNYKAVITKLTEDEIASIIQYANHHYYNLDKPVISDNVYDAIREYLHSINPDHPILKHIGAVIDDDERKVKLPYWMGSMDKIKSDNQVIDKWKKSYEGSVIISDKLDGNSGLFQWKNEKCVLYTRGNGIEGLNISHLLPFILNIPDIKNFKNYKEFTVRGELIIADDDFEKVKDKGANARNMVAGLLNAKLPNLELVKYIQFVSYELIMPHLEPAKQFKLMKDIGFKTVYNAAIPIKDVSADTLSKILLERRTESEFTIDGIIVYHNALHNRMNGENPKHAFAFKSVAMMDRAEVIVTEIEWNISKDGLLKPVIIFDGVNLSGAVVRRATGFNGKFVKDNHIGVGAKIVIMRSGDVIPHIVEVVDKAVEVGLPENINYKWTESGVDIVVSKSNAGEEINLKNMIFFFQKIKVVGLSEGILAKMQKSGYDNVGKIITMKKEDLLKLEGFKEKLADKIYDAIQQRFLKIDPVLLAAATNAFGRGIGERKLKTIVDKFPEILYDKKCRPSVSELVKIEGIEEKTAKVILDNLPVFREFVKDNHLEKYFKLREEKEEYIGEALPQIFKDKGFIFTGVRDDNVEAFIVASGGVIKKAISKNVNVLICKDKNSKSSKMEEARKLGIEIVQLDEFKKLHKV